ncbi:hypothetical protein TWF569_005229 [Orbilia oligospora]|uniref:Peptidase S8/S53 domain-containing protein n=1 Tax=Orbilia oligospora TaxID=2813651 RepID=A0A7C8NCR8_ORBOL|nr:hypothetical protein TWF102_008846 [Orbilia oligospora]KAF3149160.1 hypothetical protein TWF569_005229 [Orbilia oligospora]
MFAFTPSVYISFLLVLSVFLPNQCESKQVPSHQRGIEEYGNNIRLWWFIVKVRYWRRLDVIIPAVDDLMPCGMTQDKASIGGHNSHYLGMAFITVKTDKNMACSEEELGRIYKKHENILAGWGEVPYATPPHRITEHADAIVKPGVVDPDPDETVPEIKNKPNSKHAGKLKFGSMANRLSNQPKPSRPKSKPEKPDYKWEFGYDNPIIHDGRVRKHKDVSSGSKLRPRDPDPKPPSCPTADHNITITIESFDERRKICQSPNTSLEEIGGRCYTRSTTGCSQGEGVTIYLIETGVDDDIAGNCRPLKEHVSIGPDNADDFGDIPAFRHHGTAMLSLISHKRLGYAPKADVILVKYYNKYGYYTTAHLFNAMIATFDEIMDSGIKQVIISCAWFFDQVQPDNPLFADVYDPPDQNMRTNDLIRWLSVRIMTVFRDHKGIIVVTSTGNEKLIQKINPHNRNLKPEYYLSPTRESGQFPDVIVPVGASDRQDMKMFDDIPGSNAVKVRAWAPGEGIHVAGPNYDANAGIELATGVSFAVGIVVGLLASYISEGVPITKAIQHLYDLAWPRVPGGPNIVWNGVEKDEWPGGIPHLPPRRPSGYQP